jgi:hypothetical protein
MRVLRSDVLACLADVVVPAREPAWAEWQEAGPSGEQLVWHLTRDKTAYASPSAFWVLAVFNFLEDRDEDARLRVVAGQSLCLEIRWGEFLDALTVRQGAPLPADTFPLQWVASEQVEPRVHLMIDSAECWAALVESDGAYMAVFSALPAGHSAS